MSDSTDKLIGQTVDGRFRLDRLLGIGGMGRVYHGIQLSVDRPVAVKLLRSDLSDIASLQKRFFREAQVLASLHHPNIVGLVDFGRDDELGALYMAMQFVDGRSLADLMKAGRLPLGIAFSIARQMCSGLAEAHAAGIIHRDLKPENVMLQTTAEGMLVAKILDFGIALPTGRDETRLTSAGGIMGTPYYMSPEQAQDMDVSAASDLYALGVILYEMITGQVPFIADTPIGVLYKTVNEKHTPVQELLDSPRARGALTDVIDALLSKDPARRPASATEVARRLDELQADVDVPAVQNVDILETLAQPAIQGPDVGGHRSNDGGDWADDHTQPPKQPLIAPRFAMIGALVAFVFFIMLFVVLVAAFLFVRTNNAEKAVDAPRPTHSAEAIPPRKSVTPKATRVEPPAASTLVPTKPAKASQATKPQENKTKKQSKKSKKVVPSGLKKRSTQSGACQNRECSVLLTSKDAHYACQNATCEVECEAGGCSQVCQADSTCTFHCAGGGCRQSCFGGTTCELSCSGDNCNRTAFSGSDVNERD